MSQQELNNKINKLFLESIEKINTFTTEEKEKCIKLANIGVQYHYDHCSLKDKPYYISVSEKILEYYKDKL